MKLSREQEILNGVIKILKRYLDPGKIILFGSRAKGRFYKNADFDFAVDIKKVDINTRRKIDEEIEKVAGLYKIDIVFLGSVDEEFKDIVLETGKVLYDKRD